MQQDRDLTGATLESAPIVCQTAFQRLEAKTSKPHHRVLSGSAMLLAGLSLATLFNFAYIIAVARLLGPVGFAHTTVVYTLLILTSAITLSFQILTAKMVAQQGAAESRALTYRGFHRWSWAAGVFVSLSFVVFRNAITGYLNLPDSILIVLLATGTLFYIPLGARRGYLQGVCNFRQFSLDLIVEGFCRLCGSLLLIQFGWGVRGVVAANATAVAMAYFFAQPSLSGASILKSELPVSFRESLQAMVFFIGQVVINNCDIVVVKHLFPSVEAGIYAAVALVGRVVFVFSWAVVTGMFPIAAETRSRSLNDRGVLSTALLLVSGICLAFSAAIRLAPSEIWAHLFGARFAIFGAGNVRSLLLLYALSAGVYCLSVVLIAYEMSHKIANTGWVQLVVGGAVVAGIYRYHSSLAQVIWVQIFMMAILLLWVAIPFLLSLVAGDGQDARPATLSGVRLGRRVSEDEVIAEFLRNDSHSPKLQRYRGILEKLVVAQNLQDDDQNELRRALFNIRHAALWRELPKDTQWFEVEIQPDTLDRIRVFPRAQWRKLAAGDFRLLQVAQRIVDERYRDRVSAAFLGKIDVLRTQLKQDVFAGAVLLIGEADTAPLTILDGNHRLVAATLNSSELADRFRFYCGLSPNMTQCCWYRTNVATLLRYGTNLVRHLVHDPESDLTGLLQQCEGVRAEALGPN